MIVQRLFLTLLLYYRRTIVCTEPFPRWSNNRFQLLNISLSTTPSYDRWTVFSIDLVLRSVDDCSNSFAIVEWLFVENTFFTIVIYRFKHLYNIGSTTTFYDCWTVFFIYLVLRSLNDRFELFYLTIVEWSFVTNPFDVRCYDWWTIVLNDPFFLSSNDNFWRSLFTTFEQSFQRSFLTISDRSLRRTHFHV